MAAITPLKVGRTADGLAAVKTPDTFNWGLQDVSSADAGRVNDASATMYKNRVTQKRKISLAWNDPDGSETAAILQAFNPEYFFVRYFDPMANAWETRQFYAGDRSAPYKWIDIKGGTRLTTLSFNIIER